MSETYRHLDPEVNDLAPTVVLADRRPGPPPAGPRPEAAVALVEGRPPSLTAETHSLRRRRLLAAAVFLAATFGLLTLWVFLSDNPGTLTAGGSRYSLRVGFLAARCALAAAVAALLASGASLTRTQLRAAEYVLFLGLSLLLMASQYFVGLDLMRRGPEYLPILLAFVKDGVIQMMALMTIYGTLVPNPPAVAVRALAAMFAIPVVTTFLLTLHPDAAPFVGQLGTAEEAGSNLLFLAIGAALAVYGSFLLNGLRAELHEARKFGQYRLVRKIGAGGMGEVYLAEHPLLKRPCALKLIKPEASADPLALARFEREVQESARLAPPQHHRDLRLRPHRRRDVLLRDGVPPGDEPGRAGRGGRPAAGRPRDPPLPAGLRGPGGGARRWAWSTATSSPRTSSSRSWAARRTSPRCSTSAWSSRPGTRARRR